jgi:hypothetical protein
MNARTHVVLLAVLAACSQRPVDDDDTGPAPTPPDAGTSEPGDGDGEVVCRDGLTACEGTCVDLSSNDEHCGVCSHACKIPAVYGWCEDGACPPAPFCGSIEQGFTTCDQVCAWHGQRCFDGPRDLARGSCGGGYILSFPELTMEAIDSCEGDIGSSHGVEATCSTPIDWSITGGWEHLPAGAVACCCTQDPVP